MRALVPAFLLPRPQPHRGGLRQDRAPLTRGLRQDQGGVAGGDRGGALGDQRPRRPGLLRACRIPSGGSPTVKRAVIPLFGWFLRARRRIGPFCVIFPICTENELRFSARLDNRAPEVRFERVGG